ncbi:protein adenylyltransferase SelO family protein [Chondromyces apiculatus]|nr:YdiU family protein [Chondromyces apiculatus]
MPMPPDYRPDPRIRALQEGFFDAVKAATFPEHLLRFRNQRWATRVGLGDLTDDAWVQHFTRFEPLPGNLEQPLALRYHGHQFGVYNPALGDGRGFLFAQLRDAGASPQDPERDRLLDLGTKGSGRTPWSRGGDGRLTLKGGVREVLATEMLEALGVYTSKTFSLVETGESLYRGDEPSPTRSSVLVRLSHSHIRFGSFQRHAHLGHVDRLGALLDFAVEHYLPGARERSGPLPLAFLHEVTLRAAALCASLMTAGFVHGVLNTDNMNITGECFDYGPYRFLPTLDPTFTAAYFDHEGLYAFGRQPRTFVWNLARLAEALTPLCPDTALAPALREFQPAFLEAMRQGFLRRLGVASNGADDDAALLDAADAFLQESQIGYDRFFFDWYGGLSSTARARQSPEARTYAGTHATQLQRALERHAPTHPERLEAPYFQGSAPCSLLIDEIESIWQGIAERDDWSAFHAKVDQIRAFGALMSG